MRTVILIQGQERSHQERAAAKKQELEGVGVMIKGTIELSGIEECYNKLPPLFKDQQKFKCFSISCDDVNLTSV